MTDKKPMPDVIKFLCAKDITQKRQDEPHDDVARGDLIDHTELLREAKQATENSKAMMLKKSGVPYNFDGPIIFHIENAISKLTAALKPREG